MSTSAVFYMNIDTHDMFNPNITMDACHIFEMNDEMKNIGDVIAMMTLDMPKDEATKNVMDEFPELEEVSFTLRMMDMRAQFDANVQGPFLIHFDEEIPHELINRTTVENVVLGRSKESLQSFLKSAKI